MIDFNEERHRDALSLMLELGFTCAYTGYSRECAQTLMDAHKAARPDGPASTLGEALLLLCFDNNAAEAVTVLRRTGIDYRDTQADPDIVSMLAFLLMHAGHKAEAETIAQHLLDHADDAGALRMARSIQDELRH
ncbi:MAG: hypothetical protein OXD47_03880 [Gammaproteobacteria bacterium]|nr:hypothetical protein [Gammaproteobacteria bacterium]MCY4210457.1 hypothetical protein [Gammaproteobacteria bacterium]MCY4283016.1 hypothetical protein [Gammaproteobacteria bacterium]MCY4337919.1 hypothetical protein [Gammaproteobacteria bacterium]